MFLLFIHEKYCLFYLEHHPKNIERMMAFPLMLEMVHLVESLNDSIHILLDVGNTKQMIYLVESLDHLIHILFDAGETPDPL